MEIIKKHFELKNVEAEGEIFTGIASAYGVVDSDNDRIMPGAFIKSLGKRTPALLFGHEHSGIPVGKFTKVEDTNDALVVTGSLTKGGSRTKDLADALAHGSLSGLSVGFKTNKAVKNSYGGVDVIDAELIEISLTGIPANPASVITSVKSINSADVGALGGIKEIESVLRELGLSKGATKALIHAIKGMDIAEEEEEEDPADDNAEEEALEAINKALQKLLVK